MAVRQLSSVLLKQYVEAHWSQQNDKFQAPEASPAAKSAIRNILPVGLKESISKVRTSVAYAISAIAHWDWPEAWPELFDILMALLTSGDHNAVHGAMRVLTEFCREVTDTQISQVAPVILPEMYKIFTQFEIFSIRTRGRAVDIFNTMANMVSAMADVHKGIAKQLLFPVLPQFTQAFVAALQVPDGATSDSGLKMEVIKALTTLVKGFPGTMMQWMQQILAPIWNILTQSVDIYQRTVVNDVDDVDNPVDSDGEVLGFENLVFGVFDFIHALIDTNKYRSTVKKAIGELLYFIVLYMQITEEQIQTWTENPDQFVEDEDDDTFSYSVRISSQDLLLSLASEFSKEGGPAICQAITRHIHEAESAKNSGNANWWKIHEAAMLTMGSVKTMVAEQIHAGTVQFDIHSFLHDIILADLDLQVSPFLLGRCLWTASRFASLMQPELLQRFLHVTVKGLNASHPASVRISAVRAIYSFCEHLKSADNRGILVPFLPTMLSGLLETGVQYAAEVLALCLETIAMILSISPEFTATVEQKVAPFTIAIFLKCSGGDAHNISARKLKNRNPLIVSLTQDIFSELSKNEGCRDALLQRLVPTLTSILNAPMASQTTQGVPIVLPPVALDILETLVRNSSIPLPALLITQAFPAAIQFILHTDDNQSLQSGGDCIRAYISVALEQVVNWHDAENNNGLYYTIQVISKLLHPKTSEFAAAFVGRLVSVLISKIGSGLGENLGVMLRAVLCKLQQTDTLSVTQSLVMIFAHLVHSHFDELLEFLSNEPGPTGNTALEFVLTEWVSRQHLFYGAYENKVSTIALAKLLLHAIQKNDKRFNEEILVKGDPISLTGNEIRTRSKASKTPEQWTSIPVSVKIYKLLINELSTQLEENSGNGEDDEWEESDEGEGDDLEEEAALNDLLKEFAPASAYVGFDLNEYDDDEDDPDTVDDPINKVNLQTYLTEYLQELSQQPCYSHFQEKHSPLENQVLKQIGINNS
ncbi:unnamed protein product [Owenia fusiformis]|uniref:Uncharacterized protein n=1 Tax=Owenia fusiformis TaxID=6347 RepID=A0A8J1T523_OWEFU|nr:unnamed protein product [Owenia fusiformis]